MTYVLGSAPLAPWSPTLQWQGTRSEQWLPPPPPSSLPLPVNPLTLLPAIPGMTPKTVNPLTLLPAIPGMTPKTVVAPKSVAVAVQSGLRQFTDVPAGSPEEAAFFRAFVGPGMRFDTNKATAGEVFPNETIWKTMIVQSVAELRAGSSDGDVSLVKAASADDGNIMGLSPLAWAGVLVTVGIIAYFARNR